jgi:hypothetical protein
MDALFHTRHFSLREANVLVPMLQRTFVQARSVRDELQKVQARLKERGLPAESEEIEVDPAQPPAVRELQARGKELAANLMATLQEVAQLGIEVKGADGLCDFRTRLAGRTVYLCWRFGEEKITHFHELHTGFSGRKPLPEGAEFVGELLH